MGEEKSLYDQKAVEKLKQIIDDIPVCMFTTNLEQLPLNSRPMYTQEVDEKGLFWFFLTKEGSHYDEIREDPRVQLFYSCPNQTEYLSVFGKANISIDRNKLEELWDIADNAWFEDIDDPNLALAYVQPEDAYYWDTKNNRLVTLLKIAASAVTGNRYDGGIQGELKP